jgi:hypothetical protein
MIFSQQGLNPVLMDSVMNGAQTAMNECKNVFKWSRWNCPQSAFSKYDTRKIIFENVSY